MSGYYFPPPPPPPQSNAPPPPPAPDQHPNFPPGRGGRGQHRGGRGRGRGASSYNPGGQHHDPRNGGQQYGPASQTPWTNPQQHQNGPSHGYNPPNQWLPSHIPPPPIPVQYPSAPHGPGPYAPRGGYNHLPLVPHQAQAMVPHHPPQVSFNSSFPQVTAPPMRMGFNESHNRFPPAKQSRNHQSPNPYPGQKRRREHSPNNPNRAERGKIKPAPAIPSFGFSLALPPKPPPVASSAPERPKKKKRRKTNQLGLTPKGDTRDDTDEDIDEEAAFANSGGPVNIQYRGSNVSLNSEADIQSWLAERKKRFPTKERVAEKLAHQEKMREERRAKQKMKQNANADKRSKAAKGSPAAAKPSPPATKEDEADRQRKKLEKHLRKAEKLREQLKRTEIKHELATTSSEMTNTKQEISQSSNPVEENASSTQAAPSSEGQAQPDSHVNRKEDVSMSESSESSSSDDSSDSDSDAVPEVQTSKGKDKHRDTKMPKQPRGNSRTNTEVPCKYFLRDGNCRRKDCRFLHNTTSKPKEKITLYDRLVEQELRDEASKALHIIKRLGESGILD